MSRIYNYPATLYLLDDDEFPLSREESKTLNVSLSDMAEGIKERVQNNFLGNTNFRYQNANNVDVDTIKEEFHGYVRNGKNTPNGYAAYGMLDVSRLNNWVDVRQIFTAMSSSAIFMRFFNESANKWSDWMPLLTPGMVSNPNLLINPNFKINQRGISERVFDNTKKNYFVDRWRTNLHANATVTVHDRYITVTQDNVDSAGGAIVNQWLENYSDFAGMTLTLSAKIRGNGENIWMVINDTETTEMVNNATSSEEWQVYTVTKTISNSVSRMQIGVGCNGTAGNSVDIAWAKLEVGEIATPFVPPDPATELVKCQRYYERSEGGVSAYGYVTMNASTHYNSLYFNNVYFSTEKRIIPTLSLRIFAEIIPVSFPSSTNYNLATTILDEKGFAPVANLNNSTVSFANGMYKIEYIADAEIY